MRRNLSSSLFLSLIGLSGCSGGLIAMDAPDQVAPTLTDAELRSEANRQRQLAENDVPGALEKTRALDTEAWRRFDVSHSTDLPTL